MNTKPSDLLLDLLHRDEERLDALDLAGLAVEEWEGLVRLARTQRVAPLVYHRLVERGFDSCVPEEVLRALRGAFIRNTARNLCLIGEFGRIAAAFEAKGVPLIALKGIHLAHDVYESAGLREMSDMDILVRKADLAKAAEIVAGMGFEPMQPFMKDLEPVQKHLPKFVKKPATVVELHHTLAMPPRSRTFNVPELWERACPTVVRGATVFVLSPEDALLYLCFHNALHVFGFGLRPYCDIQAAISRASAGLDWDAVAERARRWTWERGVYLTLWLARELIGAECPDSVLDALRPCQDTERIYAIAKAQLFTDKMMTEEICDNVARFVQMRMLERVGLLARRFFPTRLEMAHMHHTPPNSLRIMFTYPTRWKDLFVRYWGTLRAARGGDEELTTLAERQGKLLRWLEED